MNFPIELSSQQGRPAVGHSSVIAAINLSYVLVVVVTLACGIWVALFGLGVEAMTGPAPAQLRLLSIGVGGLIGQTIFQLPILRNATRRWVIAALLGLSSLITLATAGLVAFFAVWPATNAGRGAAYQFAWMLSPVVICIPLLLLIVGQVVLLWRSADAKRGWIGPILTSGAAVAVLSCTLIFAATGTG